MMTTWRRGRALLITAMLMAAAAAHAGGGAPGGDVFYGPIASVPTLSEWMVLGTGLLLALVAWRALRSRVNGRLLSNLVLVGGAAVLSWWGAPLVGKVMAAISFDQVSMTSPGGGKVHGERDVEVTNRTEVSQAIRDIKADVGYSVLPARGSPECKVGTIVAPNMKCFVRFGG